MGRGPRRPPPPRDEPRRASPPGLDAVRRRRLARPVHGWHAEATSGRLARGGRGQWPVGRRRSSTRPCRAPLPRSHRGRPTGCHPCASFPKRPRRFGTDRRAIPSAGRSTGGDRRETMWGRRGGGVSGARRSPVSGWVPGCPGFSPPRRGGRPHEACRGVSRLVHAEWFGERGPAPACQVRRGVRVAADHEGGSARPIGVARDRRYRPSYKPPIHHQPAQAADGEQKCQTASGTGPSAFSVQSGCAGRRG